MDFFIQLIISSILILFNLSIPKIFSSSKIKLINFKNKTINRKEIIVIITGLTILIIGIIGIYFFAERNERLTLILIFGTFMNLLQQFILRLINKKIMDPS
ncbi:hypothetical protein HPK19_25445 (plasmid) [Arthrobacter citreus]|nr:hypothetical protein HPK19_25445 [Arthrobacter citreus]